MGPVRPRGGTGIIQFQSQASMCRLTIIWLTFIEWHHKESPIAQVHNLILRYYQLQDRLEGWPLAFCCILRIQLFIDIRLHRTPTGRISDIPRRIVARLIPSPRLLGLPIPEAYASPQESCCRMPSTPSRRGQLG